MCETCCPGEICCWAEIGFWECEICCLAEAGSRHDGVRFTVWMSQLLGSVRVKQSDTLT